MWLRRSSSADLRVDAAYAYGHIRGLRVVAICRVVVGSVVAEFLQARDFEFVLRFVAAQLRDLLAGGDELLVLIIEALIAMAAYAAALAVKLACRD